MIERQPTDLPQWTAEAKDKLNSIPFFVRSQARNRIEAVARSQALETVTADLVEQVRLQFGQ
ncbi:PCP reductase family protein [Pseudanabaena sp. FACHB-2040]|uniref:PCP reductase family protein n=1 Tax=Pseudanabaena sp. FACHB-2040 TaxID=2692859 RepID=UPI001689AB14|nr:PCP reductase family protein [Pseudanabaena sp. FACHB-2040]MBD0267069.1 PCP reductase family protein [Cyanobacteria bacterium Co-bin8]MBD2259781.1 PCP reductase family protein [Pseudanabaena sp. FACHB-2040]